MKRVYSKEMSHLVRWCFQFKDHKPNRAGMWSRSGVCSSTNAWLQDKNNLAYAFIETKGIITREIKPRVIVPGEDFMNFQWVAASGFKVLGSANRGKLPSTIIGLSVLTRHKKITVFIDGTIDERNIYEQEKTQNLAGFGR